MDFRTRAHGRRVRIGNLRRVGTLAVVVGLISVTLSVADGGFAAPAHAVGASTFDGTDGIVDAAAAAIPDTNSLCENIDTDTVIVGGLNFNSLTTAVPPVVRPRNAPGKSDLCNIYAASEVATDGDAYLYLGWDRRETNGSTVIVFELSQVASLCTDPFNGTPDPSDDCNPFDSRSDGDIAVLFDFQGGVSVSYRVFSGGFYGSPLPVDAPNFEASLDATTAFGEAVINLSASVFANATQCLTLGSVGGFTQTGNAEDAQVKDWVPPSSFEPPLTNCSTVDISKVTVPGGLPDTFDITLTGNVVDGAPSVSETVSLADGEVATVEIIGNDDYTLTEIVDPSQWQILTMECTDLDGNWVDVTGDAVASGTSDPFILFSDNHPNACRVTNTPLPGSITLVKEIQGAGGTHDFDFTLAGDPGFSGTTTLSPTAPDATGSGTASVTFVDLPAGPNPVYSVSEVTPAPWTLLSATCDDGSDPAAIAISGGEDVTCTFVNAAPDPTLAVTKTAAPTSVDENGGPVRFSFEIVNTTVLEALTLTSLADSIFGDLNGLGDCTLPQDLAADGGTYSCSATFDVTGNAGDVIVNELSATAQDAQSEVVTELDTATVTIADVESSIEVTKTPTPPAVDEPGGDVTFDVTIENTSPADTVNVTSVVDDVFGDIGATCTTPLPVTLDPGATFDCTFTEFVAGTFGDVHENTVTVLGTDDDGAAVSATATANVTFNDVNFPPIANDDTATTPEDTPVTVDATGNDTDFDSNLDPATATVDTAPSNGTVVANGDGTFTYTPNQDFSGTDSFTYRVCDTGLDGIPDTGDELCDAATVTIDVTPVNDPPVASDDTAATDEDTPVAIDVLANDSDVEGGLDPSSVTVTQTPLNGTVVVNADGSVTYSPNADFNGTDSFTYEVCDTDGLCDTATVTVTVAAVNDPPVANDDAASTNEDTPVTVGAAANDTDVDGNLDPTTATVVAGPANGTVVSNGDGTFTYTPDTDFNGTDSLTYEICDTDGACDTATVTVTVGAVNDAPDAVDDAYATDEDVTLTVDAATGVLGNDTDVDGDSLTATLLTGTSNGTVTLNPDGSFDYVPNADFNGTDSFTYEACDPDGLCDVATATITIDPMNDAPVANDDAYTTPEDTLLTVVAPGTLGNDGDVDGDTLTATLLTGASNGTVTLNPDGSFEYVPDADFNGTDSFTYEACDPDGLCDTATATIDVTPVNDPPVANDDTASTPEDTAVTVDAAANDTDVDGNLDPATATVVADPANGTVASNGDGTFTYSPNADFNGTDSFTYEICDTDGLCDTATVTVFVAPVDDAPVAVDDEVSTLEDAPVTVDAAANDTDVDGNLDPATATVVADPANGTVASNGDGTFTYTPNADFNGTDSFTYQICDTTGLCAEATVTIEVLPVNDPPVAVDDAATTDEDTPVTVDAAANDTDVDGSLDPTSATALTDPANGTVTSNGDGTFTYTPNDDFNGTDSFTYEICDTDGLCDTATVTVTVDPINDPPVANDDAATTDEDTPVTVDAAANDTDVDANLDPATATVLTDPANGTVVANGDGTFEYTPNQDFTGTDTFTYEICDTDGLCDTAAVTVTVDPVNDPPVANDDAATTPEDTAVTVDAAANDTDVDGNLDPTTATALTDPANGTVTNNGDGTFTYTPNQDFTGTDTFTYEICDTDGLCDTAIVSITVDPVNDAPVANDDAATTPEDTAVTVDVAANDTDVDGNLDPSTATVLTGPANGTVTNNGDGTFEYTPNADFNGTDTFTYEICDATGLCDSATVTITVDPVNDAPVANDDAATTPEDTPVTVDILANDTDVDGNLDAGSVTVTSTPGNGAVNVNGDGSVEYTPNADFNGTDTFVYEVCDTDGLCDTATVTVTVDAENDVPEAENDGYTTAEDTTLTVDAASGVLANDSDVDGDALTATLLTGPTNGTLTLNPDGSFEYVPNADFNGTDTFTYEACDPGGLCDTAVATITVDPVNDAPVANDDAYSTLEETPLNIAVPGVLGNDSDVDGDALTATVVTGPANGTLTLNADGSFDYTPNLDFTGTDTFTYDACDPDGLCDTATVTITVDPVNDAPVANDDTATTPEDTPVTVDAAANDTDVDGNLDPTTTAVVTGPTNGTVTNNGDGTFEYTPNQDFTGTDTFTYEICDTDGLCDTAIVSITVDPVNDAPVANDDAATTPEDTAVTVDVAANDTDVDGNLDPSTATVLTGPANGTVTNNGDGTFEYTPNADFNGTDTFTYEICDATGLCDSATVTITVDPVNDAPVANDDAATTPEDTPVTVDILANDTDVDGNLDAGSVTVTSTPGNGAVNVNGDGSVEYTPNADFNGTDTFVYEVCDTDGMCDTATVTITVDPVNDAPVANDDTATTTEEVPVIIDVAANDTDVDGNLDPATATVQTGPGNGTVANNGDGTFEYTPNVDFTGTDTFVYEVCDTDGLCDTATVTVTVDAENDVPEAENDGYTTAEDTTLTVDAASGVLANDSDVDGDALTATLLTGPTNGTLTLNPDGSFEYVPNADFNGTDTFTYEACDPGGLCDTAVATITVDPVNDAPVANDDAYSTLEETPLNIAVPGVLGNDSDVDGDALTATVVTGPANGTLTLNADGSFDYTPNLDFTGTDTFTYDACDPDGLCDTATVTITVDPVNDAPVANDDTATTPEDTPVTVDAAANDTDVDGNLDPTTTAVVTGPTNGTVTNNGDGTFEYTPNQDFTGTDTFTYEICDTDGLCDTAIVSITVDPVNDAPVANDDADTTDEDTPVNIDVLANDSDVDGDVLVVDAVTQPANGSVVIEADGTVTYTPDADFNGTDTFTYDACDPDGLCDTATVTITVNPVNDAPDAVDDAGTTPEDTPVNVDVLANDTDPDGDVLVVDAVTQPANGSVVIEADGTVMYTPDPDFNGTDTFTYTACDPGGLCDIATVTITVDPVNDAPVANDDAATTDEDTPVNIDVLANDTDVDGDVLVVDAVTQPANGSVVIEADGTVTYTPDPDFNGTDTFTYTACDPDGLCDTATVTVDVASGADVPVAVDDFAATPEDTPVNIDVLANDSDIDGDPLTIDSVTQPANGTVVIDDGGTVTYTPNPDFNGTDTFTYTVCDPDGLCDTATVTVTVDPVNDAPVANDDAETTDEEVPVNVDVLGNDSDVDGDVLVVDAVTQPANGSVVVEADGTVTYTPNPDFNGTDTFTYDVCDPDGLCDTATVTVTVNSVNDAPVANDDTATTDEDTAVDIDVLGNDSDIDGDPLTIDSVTQPANGTVVIDDGGTVTYTPNPDFNGTDTFTYTVCDPDGLCDTATVTVTVDPVNDAPVANDDAETTDEEVPVNVDVLGNDSDVDGDVLVVDAVTQPANGSVVVEADGTVTYTPDPDFNGVDTFTYDVCDPDGLCDTATVTVTVNSVNDAPVANDDTATTDEDTAVDIDVLANDSDIDGDPLTIDSVTQPANGTVVIDDGGTPADPNDDTVTYTPDPDFNGTDTFTYTICDPTPLCDTATVTVTVDAVNDAPVANGDAETTGEEVPVNVDVLGNDSDVDGDVLVVDAVTQPANGSVVVEADGTVTYTPNPDFNGVDTFTYDVCDPDGLCDTATVTVTVNSVNDAPVANDDTATTDEDTAVDIDVLANDSDIDGDTLVVDAVTQPANGSVVVDADGTVTYTPNPDFNGTDTFTYTVCDPDGLCDTATVTVTVDPVNDAPVANDDADSTEQGFAVTVPVLNNDLDVDDGIDSGSVTVTTTPGNGTAVVEADGTITYTPALDFTGTDTFEYQVCDFAGLCDTAVVTVLVTDNTAPDLVDDSAATPEDTPVSVDVLVNDSDPDGDPLITDSVTQPANGSVVIETDGTVTYTPDPDFNGTDTFTYTACDDGVPPNCSTATVTVTVDPVNDAPVANDDAETTDEEVPVNVDVLGNDSDVDGDVLVVDAVTQPANGSVVVEADGTVTYTPDPDFNGTDTFTYDVCDPDGLCDTATVTVTVNSVNDAPVANDDTATTDEDTAVDIDVLANDSDIDGDPLTIDSVTQPANGSVVIDDGGTPADPNDDTVTYTPDPDFNGTDTFTYTVCDPDGLCDTATVTVTVDSVNDAPVANDDAETTDEEVPVNVDVLGNDSDVDGDVLVVDAVTQPANGSVVVEADGTVTYTPDPDFNGVDTFTYDVCDPDGLCDTATVTVTVNSVNDAPVANDDTATTDEDTAVDIDVLGNDSDIDGDPLTIDSVTQPANGTVVIDDGGTVTYTPNPDFNGTDTFTYTVCDPDGLCDTATVTVTVDPVNDAPVANDDAETTDEEVPVNVDVLGNDSDVDGDVLVVDAVTQPANGSVVVDADGTVTYTPNPDFNGVDTFTYTVCDPDGLCDTATVTVTVNSVNDAPVANDDTATTDEDTAVDIDVLANDSDIDGDTLVVDAVTQPANGSVVVDADGTVTYTPNPDFNGTDTFTYTVCDPDGLCDTATVSVTVDPVNDAPVANDDASAVDEDTQVNIDVLSNDSDVDGDVLTLDSVTQPASGSVVIEADGTVTYTPNPDFNGTDTFTYTVCDPDGLCDTATVTITVNPINDAPVAEEDSATTDEDTPVDIDVLPNDTDIDGDTLVVDAVTQPANGSVVVDADGTVTYTPNPDFNGTDTFTYTVCDPSQVCDTATVTVTVDPVNDAPAAVDDDATAAEDTSVDIPVLGNDSDVDGDTLTVDAVTQPANGTVVINDNGTVTYTPDPDFNGTDTFTYTVCDPDGLCDTATVTVDVTPVNDAPTAADDTATGDPGAPIDVPVLDNDTDVDGDPLTIDSVTQPANGTVVINDNGTVTYTPDPGFEGPDTFTYTVCDPDGLCDTATVTVVAGPLAALTGIVWYDLNENGVQDGAETQISGVRLVLTWAGADGVVGTADDVLIGDAFTASPYLFTGLVPGTYQIELDQSTLPSGVTQVYEWDGSLDGSLVVTVGLGETFRELDFGYLVVMPGAVDDSATTTQGQAVVIDVLGNDSFVGGVGYTITNVSDPANGFAVLNADGTITYQPDAGFVGTDTFTYTVTDENGNAVTAVVTVVVQAAPGDTLPFTGADSDRVALFGLVLALLGAALVTMTRLRMRRD